MTYDHIVNLSGVYYDAGQEVPEVAQEEKINDLGYYTYDDLNAMTVKEIKAIAEKKGISISKTIKDDVINEFLLQQ